MNNKYIDKINYHLWHKDGFLEILYEREEFDKKLFNDLIYNIKMLHKEKKLYWLFENKYELCIWKNFLANIIQRFWLLMSILSDVRFYSKNNYNISADSFHSYMEELSFELQSLFAWWDKDYHWNKYWD